MTASSLFDSLFLSAISYTSSISFLLTVYILPLISKDLGVGDVGEAGALGEVLADQAACVLVGGTLSGGCGDRRSRP